MSIWISWPAIGYDDASGLDELPRGGHVLSYADGFSNHHPDLTGEFETPATVDLAHVAPWCVPGHFDGDPSGICSACHTGHDYPQTSPFLRLSIDAPDALSWWDPDPNNRPKNAPAHASVVLDEAAARQLVDDLNQWLAMPKLQPLTTTDDSTNDSVAPDGSAATKKGNH